MNGDRREISIEERIQSWIALGADPAGARWHGALAATLAHLKPYLTRGRLVTADDLSPEAAESFAPLAERIDLPPTGVGVFLPTSLASRLEPPSQGRNLRRAAPERSRLVLLGDDAQPQHLVVGEVAGEGATGVDAFQKGCRVMDRTLDAETDPAAVLSDLAWQYLTVGDDWSRAACERYTEWWWTRCVSAGRGDLPLHASLSYLHRPERLGLTPEAAIFKLAAAVLPEVLDEQDVHAGEGPGDADGIAAYVESRLLSMLELLRRSEIVDFSRMTGDAAEAFKAGFARTVRQTCRRLQP